MFRQSVFKAYQRFNWLMRQFLIGVIAVYRYLISPILGNRCRFYPSCSVYCQQAVLEWGILKGILMTIRRLLRCGPWHPGGYDPLPSVQNKILTKETSHEFSKTELK